MPEAYLALVEAIKALTQGNGTTSEPEKSLPVKEDECRTRPDVDSYGIIKLDFEADSLDGDNVKHIRSYEGTVDLYSRKKYGDGWIPLIEQLLTDHCECSWRLDYHTYETETREYRWEWVFQVEG